MMQFHRASLMATLLLFLFSAQTDLMATQEYPKWEVNLSAKITGATADKVWPLVADFCDIYKIIPTDLSFCSKGVPGKPGQIRYVAVKTPSPSNGNTTIIQWVQEELLVIDQTMRFVTYQILHNNRGVTRFIETMQILPIDDYSCQFKWSIGADPINGTTYEAFVAGITSIRDQMVEKIENLFREN